MLESVVKSDGCAKLTARLTPRFLQCDILAYRLNHVGNGETAIREHIDEVRDFRTVTVKRFRTVTAPTGIDLLDDLASKGWPVLSNRTLARPLPSPCSRLGIR